MSISKKSIQIYSPPTCWLKEKQLGYLIQYIIDYHVSSADPRWFLPQNNFCPKRNCCREHIACSCGHMEEREAKLEVSKNDPGNRTSIVMTHILFMCSPQKKHRRSYQEKNWWLNFWRLQSVAYSCVKWVTWNLKMLPWKRRNIYSKLPKVVGVSC